MTGYPTPVPTPYYPQSLGSYSGGPSLDLSKVQNNPGLTWNSNVLSAQDQNISPNIILKNPTSGGGYSSPSIQAPTQPSAPTAPDMSQIDSVFNPAMGIYNDMYNQAVSGKQDYLDQYTKPYDAEKPNIDNAYNTGINQSNQQKLNALDSAKQMYQELMQGNRQRFGGMNSAGDMANMFYNREYQRQQGNIQNSVGQRQQDLLDQYNTNLSTLQAKKESALSQAQAAFQQRLDSINSLKGQLEQNKAGLKFQALQDYRNLANQIQQQWNQFNQQLYANHVASLDQLRNTISAYGSYANSQTPISTWSPTAIGQTQGGQSYDPNSITGYIDYLKKNQGQTVQ